MADQVYAIEIVDISRRSLIVVVDLITTVPDTLSPGVKVLDGRLSFISRIVDDIVTLQENINVYDSSQLFQTDSAVQ